MTRHNYEMKYSLEAATRIFKETGTYRVVGYRWRDVFLKHVVALGTHTRARWCGHQSWRRDYPQLRDETTYEQCIEAVLQVVDGQLTIKLVIYDGDTVTGRPTTARCEFVGTLSVMCPELERAAGQAFAFLVDCEVTRREEARLARLRAEVEAQFTRDFGNE
jgi:hypothetical protein